MFKIETRNKPRGKIVREGAPDDKCVRVYRNSPDDLILQIWNGKRYMLVVLYPQEARAIAAQLIADADELDGMRSHPGLVAHEIEITG